jgi:chromate transporter
VTFFTFLPSFIFIFAGAPFIESSKNNLKLNAPLSAISAAVVGLIAALALFFALHVLRPNMQSWAFSKAQGVDFVSLGLIFAAFIALTSFKLSTIKLIVIFALFGVVLQYL